MRCAPARQDSDAGQPCSGMRPGARIDACPILVTATGYIGDRPRRPTPALGANGIPLRIASHDQTTIFTILPGTTTIFFGVAPATYLATSGFANAACSI